MYDPLMAKRPEEQLAEMIESLKQKTGKSLDEWVVILEAAGVSKHGQMMTILKGEYGVSHGFANQIALRTVERLSPETSTKDVNPIDLLFSGPKEALRPIYDDVVRTLNSFGPDVDFAPKKGYVSVRRSKQFAILQPSTASRIDIGINLKGFEPGTRLEASGTFNAMLSHRVRVTCHEDLDDELIGWLRLAYESA
jgi:Domain of unknown function (DUF5655)/Domain of unknown function (DUF4287)